MHDARRLCYDRHLRLQYIRYQRDSGGLSCYEVFNNRLYSWTGFEIRRYFYAASVSDRNIYHENEAYSYLIIGIICFVLGCLITLKKVKHPQIFNREGFVAVALSWIVLSIFGAIPFVITGEIPSYVDALFETISGFTTTGASILSNVEALTHTSLMWRSFTHWVGGDGGFSIHHVLSPSDGRFDDQPDES